ncbi:hypothetical protein [Lysobacter gummosus]|uniref:hypothetical protein n=1 Tax=Lysobacter gummosus TaxID=262324 RepID=UPI003630C2E5
MPAALTARFAVSIAIAAMTSPSRADRAVPDRSVGPGPDSGACGVCTFVHN